MNIAIIGGGAAGFFAAITVKEKNPSYNVTIIEKARQPLRKVKVSGGGRCNLSNSVETISELIAAYPRGGKELKKVFGIFNNKQAFSWFEERNVPLVVQEDGCVFPESQDSETIIQCFLNEAERLGINIELLSFVDEIKIKDNKFQLGITSKIAPIICDKVIVTTGGSPKIEGLDWLQELGHTIVAPIPSLFSFNTNQEAITELMGLVVENVIAKIQGEKIIAKGALLITHWGLSGPAILKLSSFGAKKLYELNYTTTIQINWAAEANQEEIQSCIQKIIQENPKKKIANIRPYSIPSRLWEFLMYKCSIADSKTWQELGKKDINRIVNIIANDEYSIKGQSTHAEEFVTCGGVSLQDVNMKTMESKICPNLYFAGEVLDIDAITGGFNLQAAWSTGFVAGSNI